MTKKTSPPAAPVEKLLGSIRSLLGRVAYLKAEEVEAALSKAGDRLIAELDALAAEPAPPAPESPPEPEPPAPSADPVEFKAAFELPPGAAKPEKPAAKKAAKK